MLGKREPQIYGSQTLADIETHLQTEAQKRGYQLDYFQANGEEPLLNRIHQAFGNVDFIIINLQHLPTPVLPYAMHCWRSLFLLWKCISPTSTPANLFAITLI